MGGVKHEAQARKEGCGVLMAQDTWKTVKTIAQTALIEPQIAGGLPQEWRDMFADLFNLWAAKIYRNRLKMRYYNGKNVLKDFGISIPPQLRDVETVVGWPKKAVDSMAVRCRFDGFTANDETLQNTLNAIDARSRLRVKYRQATESTLIHSCSFATVGLDKNGRSRIDFYSAEDASARWDDASGRIAYGMVINDYEDGQPVVMTMYTDEAAIVFYLEGDTFQWFAQPYTMGRPTIEALVYRPTFDKPFGQSRINRAVMSITDSAVREALRTEISAEFFTSPQKYLLGADPNAFANENNPGGKTKWEAYIGNIFAVGRDENGDLPQFGQLSQGSMQPHVDYMRNLAARFSGETNVPISTLGVIHDQPASAEAIYAASEPLIIECEDYNESARESLRSLALMALAAEQNVSLEDLDESYKEFMPNFRSPAMPSVVSQTDAMVKIASVVPGFAGTEVFFDQIGFAEDTRRKVLNEIARNQGALILGDILNG